MRRWLVALALVASSLTAGAQGLKGGALGRPTADYAYIPAPSGCVATSVPIFLGSPVALGCDAGLTYDAATDTLTSGRVLLANGSVSSKPFSFTADGQTGMHRETTSGYEGLGYGTGTVGLMHLFTAGAAGVTQLGAITNNGFTAIATNGFRWSSTTDVTSASDLGLARASAGWGKATDGSSGYGGWIIKGLQYVTGSRPTCDAAARGMTWYVAGGAGVADTGEMCRKDNSDVYAWVPLF